MILRVQFDNKIRQCPQTSILPRSCIQIFKYFSFFVGSIPLDSSTPKSLEDVQAFIDLSPSSSTLDVSNVIASVQTETNGKQ